MGVVGVCIRILDSEDVGLGNVNDGFLGVLEETPAANIGIGSD